MNKKDIKNYTLGELEEEMEGISEPRYRSKQIFYWLYKRGIDDFKEMQNLSRPLKDKLFRDYFISRLECAQHFKSNDKTEKFLFRLFDGRFVESVIIDAKDRMTECLSTQVGCKFSCKFCASGLKGFVRNLSASEIVDQILYLRPCLHYKITNFVFMGMGEPLDNFENLKKTLLIMNDPYALKIAARRITISSCGLVPGIKKLKDLGLQVDLSISLHAANDKVRDALMPINRSYPLAVLIKACEDYIKDTKRMITLEYVLIKDRNDSLEDALGLAAIAWRLKARVNLLAISRVTGFNFEPTPEKNVISFMQRLMREHVNVTLRRSKGKDIQAACGQLAGRTNN